MPLVVDLIKRTAQHVMTRMLVGHSVVHHPVHVCFQAVEGVRQHSKWAVNDLREKQGLLRGPAQPFFNTPP